MTHLEEYIEAFQIFLKYDPKSSTGAEHDEFYVYARDQRLHPENIEQKDVDRLHRLSWHWDTDKYVWLRYT